MEFLTSNPFKASGVLCRSKESFLHHGSRVIFSIRLSGRLHVMLAFTSVLFLAHCFVVAALGPSASIRLTFVLLLDIGIAQAHQSHLEAEDTHFAISSAELEEEK